MFEKDYITEKEIDLLQKYTMEILNREYGGDIENEQRDTPTEYITDEDLEIKI